MDKWEETKKYLGQFSNNGKQYINEAMNKDLSSVRYLKLGDKQFWEWNFLNNGYQCILQYQAGGKGDVYRIMAFNNEKYEGSNARKALCYFREPLREMLEERLNEMGVSRNDNSGDIPF